MRISLFGVGELGHALLTGWTDARLDRSEIVGVERDAGRAARMSSVFDIEIAPAREAAARAEAAVISVRPGDVPGLLAEIGDALDPDSLLISLAAGITTSLIEQYVPAGVAVVRAMPNTAISALQGMCVLSRGSSVDETRMMRAESLLRPVGQVIRVPEDQQDAATALSGSAPAYFYQLFDHMIAAGARLGVSRDAATDMALQAAIGAAAMVRRTGRTPGQLRDAVATPGGATRAALDVLDERHAGQALEDAVLAAARRSAELGRVSPKDGEASGG